MYILYNAVCVVLVPLCCHSGTMLQNPLKLPGIGSIILTIISLNLAVSHIQRPSRNVYVKAYSKADLLLDNNLCVIAKMECSDAPKPIVNAFLRPSIIFFRTVFIIYVLTFYIYIMYSY